MKPYLSLLMQNKTRGLRPLWVMVALLILSEGILRIGPVWRGALEITDRLWAGDYLDSRVEEVTPTYQIVSEEPMFEAYLRSIARDDAEFKVFVVGDSEVAQAPGGVAFHPYLEPYLVRAFWSPGVKAYCVAMRGMGNVDAFYMLKRATAEVRPDLVVYVANSFYFGQVFSNWIRRDIGYVNDDFISDQERQAFHMLISQSEAPNKSWVRLLPFRVHRQEFVALGSSRLRALLLPPITYSGLGDRCYFPECQETDNIYWRKRLAEVRKPHKRTIKNYKNPVIGQPSLQKTYIRLIHQMLEQRKIPHVMVIPPKNGPMLEIFDARDPAMDTAVKLADMLESEGVYVIDCHDKVPETYFKGTMHLMHEGFPAWAECVGPGVIGYMDQRREAGQGE